MSKKTFLNFLNKVIFSPQSLDGKWKKKKFRFMYVLRCIVNPVASIQYYYGLQSLDYIDDILAIQPILPAKIHRPYLHKGGRVSNRAQYILDHYRFVQSLPERYLPFFLPKKNTSLVKFTGKDGEDFEIHCSSSGFDREGELMLSLYFNKTPVSRLTFSIISTRKGYTAFIGGLQGAPKDTGPEIIRCATRSCYGLFPKRIIFEAFCTLMAICNVTEFLAVSEHSHVFRQLRYRYQKSKTFVAVYSDFWKSIAGKPYRNWYILPHKTVRKPLSDIASKKRAEYKRRYFLIDHIHEMISHTVNEQCSQSVEHINEPC
ncbi:VirK/YbjX family protein [Escherichia albertii]|nr:VirK/YbjX family protein [Escherichia albertii]